MTDQNSNNQSWWTTLPGLITALATLITAIGGFIIILNSQSCNKENQMTSTTDSITITKNEEPAIVKQEATANQNDLSKQDENNTTIFYDVEYDTSILKFNMAGRKVAMQIRKASAESQDPTNNLLKFTIRCTNFFGGGFYFGDQYFRLKVDGMNKSPSSNYSDLVENNSSKDGTFEFIYAKNAKGLSLLIEYAKIKYEIPLTLIPKAK